MSLCKPKVFTLTFIIHNSVKDKILLKAGSATDLPFLFKITKFKALTKRHLCYKLKGGE